MTSSPAPGRSDGSGATPRSGDREELITATGLRFVGPAARLVSDAAAAGLDAPRRDDDILYAAHFLVRPRIGTNVVSAALSVLTGALAKVRRDDSPLERERGFTEVSGRFNAIHWKVAASADRWVGELLWRYPHAAVRGVACTTHVVLAEQPGVTTMTVRVGVPGGVPSVRGLVGAGQAHPSFLAEMDRVVRLVFDGGDAEPRTLGEHDIEPFVTNVLLSETRAHPVAVLSPTDRGEYLVPPSQLAEELLGLAHLYVLDRHATTFRLSDTLGDRRLSCYWGALRAYLPEFSCADSPDQHPVLVDDRVVDPVVRAQLRGMLARATHHRVSPPTGVDAMREPAAAAKRHAPAQTAGTARHAATPAPDPVPPPDDGRAEASPPAGAWTAVEQGLAGLSATLAQLVDMNARLLDELVRLRTTNAVRGSTAAGLERRIAGLERLLRRQLAPGADVVAADEAVASPEGESAPEEPAETLASVVRQTAVTHADALLVLDDAVRAAEASPYVDVDRAAAVLDAMALVARGRQAGTLGMSLRDAFRELGIDYRRGVSASTPDRLRQQYAARLSTGETVDCAEHIALGSTYDPRYCLRIYFTSRAPAEPRFVIAHVGRHLDVMTTT